MLQIWGGGTTGSVRAAGTKVLTVKDAEVGVSAWRDTAEGTLTCDWGNGTHVNIRGVVEDSESLMDGSGEATSEAIAAGTVIFRLKPGSGPGAPTDSGTPGTAGPVSPGGTPGSPGGSPGGNPGGGPTTGGGVPNAPAPAVRVNG